MHLLCAGWERLLWDILVCFSVCMWRGARVDGARGGHEAALGAHRSEAYRMRVRWETGEGLAALRAGRSAAALLAGPLLAMSPSRHGKHKP